MFTIIPLALLSFLVQELPTNTTRSHWPLTFNQKFLSSFISGNICLLYTVPSTITGGDAANVKLISCLINSIRLIINFHCLLIWISHAGGRCIFAVKMLTFSGKSAGNIMGEFFLGPRELKQIWEGVWWRICWSTDEAFNQASLN